MNTCYSKDINEYMLLKFSFQNKFGDSGFVFTTTKCIIHPCNFFLSLGKYSTNKRFETCKKIYYNSIPGAEKFVSNYQHIRLQPKRVALGR